MRSVRVGVIGLVLLSACRGDAVGPLDAPPPADTIGGYRWSDPAAWAPAAAPVAGGGVHVPAGRTILLDVSPPALSRLRIDGTLIVPRDAEVTLAATEVHVHGIVRAGTADAPITGRFVLTLLGPEAPDHQPVGAKALAVFPGGTLELHGAPRTTWTRLAATADAGATTLQFSASPGWRVGERVVVASTDFDANHAEEAVITGVAGASITLDRALRWRHWGDVQQVAGRPVDQRAEVALLSRNVVVQSDSFASQGFGGHVIVLPGGTMRVDGVEFHRLGQRGRLARYAVHWHMLGDAAGQYVRRAAIWQTNNRCLTIHGTDNAVAADNVCYDHLGHGYFLEDGAESGNRLERNLGLVSRVPAAASRLLASDVNPATFWITHPDNVLVGNVAAGSVGFGFWYALPAAPTGLSTGAPDRPRLTPLGTFRDNVAHSNHRPGLQVDDGPRPDGTTETTSYTPRLGALATGAPVTAVFENFRGWKHRGRAIWLRGNSQRVVGAVLSDNMIGATFANATTTIERSLIVGETANVTAVPNATFPIRGFEFYDGTVGAVEVTFAQFVARANRPASAVGYNRNNGWPTASDNFARAVTLHDANGVYLETPAPDRDGDKSGVIVDADGTLTGHAGWTIVPALPFLRTAACEARPAWNAWACPDRVLDLRLQSESNEPVAPVVLRRDDGESVRLVGLPSGPVQASMSLLGGRHYEVTQESPVGARVRVLLQRAAPGDWVQLSLPFRGDSLAVFRDGASTRLPAARSRDEVTASSGDRYFWDRQAERVEVRLVVRAGRTNTFVQLQRR
jgi:cell migration-inducing and hyaluronan-binding protein